MAGRVIITLIHGLVGWVLCGATMFLGTSFLSLEVALIVHLILAPVIFWVVSLVYFKKFNYFSSIATAVIFTGLVILVDFFIVALLIEKSLAMFASLLGTWVPFGLIFLSTWRAGQYLKAKGAVHGQEN